MLTKIKKNMFYSKNKIKNTGHYYNIKGKVYTAWSIVIGTKQDAIKKAEQRTKLGWETIIVLNGKTPILKDGRSPKKGYKNSYTILS